MATAPQNSKRNGQMFLGPGAAIDPENVRCLNVHSLEDFKQCEESDNEELHRIAMSVASHAPRGLGIKYADIKSDVRTITKAEREKDNDFSRITDRVRLTLIIPNDGFTGKTIAYLANRFTPKDNSRVLHIEDAFLRPNKDNGMRRMKILYRMESGSVGEIMVLHEGMSECDAKTRKDYSKLRAVDAFLKNAGSRANAYADVAKLSRLYGKSADSRMSAPKEFAEKCQLSQFEVTDEERRFFLVEDPNKGEVVPVMIMPDPYRPGRPLIAVRPNYETGTYDIDNSYLDMVVADNIDNENVLELTNQNTSLSPRDYFINASQSEYETYQKANTPHEFKGEPANDDTSGGERASGDVQAPSVPSVAYLG